MSEEVITVTHPFGGTNNLAFNPDGARLAVISPGSSGKPGGSSWLIVFDATSGDPVGAVPVDGKSAVAVAYSPDGKRIATGSGDGCIRIWDAATLGLLGVIRAHRPLPTDLFHVAIDNLEFSRDGRWIASAGEDGTVRVNSTAVEYGTGGNPALLETQYHARDW